MKLLLVDDDLVDRIAIKRILLKSNPDIEIFEAKTGEAALLLLESQKFDVILLDYNLPGSNGLHVLKEITHGKAGDTAVILLSGEKDEALALSCIEFGAQDFLQKQELNTNHLYKAITHAKLRHQSKCELESNRQEMQTLAETDQLTGLLNRYAFETRVKDTISFRKQINSKLSLMLLDLDNFKFINDSFGHEAGDIVLKEVSKRLTSICRDDDFMCRLGGDEFAIAIVCREKDYSYLVAQRIFKQLKKPFQINDSSLIVKCSIGIADFSNDSSDLNEVLKRADLAMYQAKAEGRNRFHYFNKDLQAIATRRIIIESELRKAIKNQAFEPYYQPQIKTVTGQVCGVEALVRWHHPTKGLLIPEQFLDIAEETGMIIDIDRIIMEKACQQLASWQRNLSLPENFKMAINISVKHFANIEFLAITKSILETYKIAPNTIELEIVESELVQDFSAAVVVIEKLNQMGVDVAIDDFGTGYSSLNYLKEMKVQTLKIDRSFLHDIPESDLGCKLLHGLLNLGKSMELKSIVEGVETEAQLERCVRYNADILQGFYFAKPMMVKDFEAFVVNRQISASVFS